MVDFSVKCRFLWQDFYCHVVNFLKHAHGPTKWNCLDFFLRLCILGKPLKLPSLTTLLGKRHCCSNCHVIFFNASSVLICQIPKGFAFSVILLMRNRQGRGKHRKMSQCLCVLTADFCTRSLVSVSRKQFWKDG